ncbi:hypothetical protein [Microvirga yunnanensis]|uniref:hypothetical protein n=1 Tax=Microvirga yunnanensis TaxID=2953740 RepID=UPI0021C751D9|nr:hypothetical protein [Microvirga sp. HBU67655]
MTNRDKLIALMDRMALSKADVADLAKASPATVDGWLKPETSKSSRGVPDIVLSILDFAGGDKVCSSFDEAADYLGLTAKRVKELALASQTGLSGALWAHRDEKPLERVKRGEHVVLSLGPVSYLLASGWVWLPVQAPNGRRVKIGVHAWTVEDADGIRLETYLQSTKDRMEARRSTAEATRLAERLEEMRMLGERLADAKDRGDDAEARRIDRALAALDKTI